MYVIKLIQNKLHNCKINIIKKMNSQRTHLLVKGPDFMETLLSILHSMLSMLFSLFFILLLFRLQCNMGMTVRQQHETARYLHESEEETIRTK